MEVAEIKARVDLREVAERIIGEPRKRGAQYSQFSAPDRADRNPSLTVWRDHFKDWGDASHAGDVFTFLEIYAGMEFKEALEYLGGGAVPIRRVAPPQSPPNMGGKQEPPGEEWQVRGWRVVGSAESCLWGKKGVRAREYLHGRGLRDDIIKEACLGYVPGPPQSWTRIAGVKIPCGITIPWIIDNKVWAVKVRVAAGKPKYMAMPGGVGGGLYWVDRVERGLPVLIVEGEFDCLIVAQASQEICPVALGSAGNTIKARWFDRLMFSPKLMARLDDDEAGRSAMSRLRGISERIRGVQVPSGKDINELYLGDIEAFWAWLREIGDLGNGDGE
jgi:DNA primase